MTRPRFSAFVRIRPGGVSDGLVHTDDEDPAYVELLTMAGAPLDVEVERLTDGD